VTGRCVFARIAIRRRKVIVQKDECPRIKDDHRTADERRPGAEQANVAAEALRANREYSMAAPSQSVFFALTALASLTCTALITNAAVSAIMARADVLADVGLNYIKLVQAERWSDDLPKWMTAGGNVLFVDVQNRIPK
jgi:hypothetical protein